jgi:YceI-like domain
MSIAGACRLGPAAGRLLVNTTRTGLGAKSGHDLTIEVTRWHGHATVDTAGELLGDHPGRRRLLPSLARNRRRQAAHRPRPRRDQQDPQAGPPHRPASNHTFRSRRVDGSAGSFTLDGELTIKGVTRPVMVQGGVTDGRVVGGATVVQSRWGLRPYSAFFGALRLRDEVKVDFGVALTQTVDGAWACACPDLQTLFPSSEPFGGVCDLGRCGAAACVDRRDPPVLLSPDAPAQ